MEWQNNDVFKNLSQVLKKIFFEHFSELTYYYLHKLKKDTKTFILVSDKIRKNLSIGLGKIVYGENFFQSCFTYVGIYKWKLSKLSHELYQHFQDTNWRKQIVNIAE